MSNDWIEVNPRYEIKVTHPTVGIVVPSERCRRLGCACSAFLPALNHDWCRECGHHASAHRPKDAE